MVFDIEWEFETSHRKNRVFVHKMAWIPLYEISDDQVWIYLDYRISKYVIKVIKKFIKEGIEFLFLSPLFSNPKNRREMDFHYQNIHCYLANLQIPIFYYDFEKIEFDLISNMIKYIKKYDYFFIYLEDETKVPIVKEIFEEINSEVQANWGLHGNRFIEWNVPDVEIRTRFNNLWREINISYLI